MSFSIADMVFFFRKDSTRIMMAGLFDPSPLGYLSHELTGPTGLQINN
jgi:hypothetical protein